MPTLFIFIENMNFKHLIIATLFPCLIACSSVEEEDDTSITEAIDNIAFAYRQTIQQGNVLDQAKINQLLPGMSKDQVQFLLGTPMLVDPFRSSRWDYIYSYKNGRAVKEEKKLTIFFDDNRLARLEGDYAPQADDEINLKKNELIVSVPDYIAPDRGWITRFLEFIGLWDTDTKH